MTGSLSSWMLKRSCIMAWTVNDVRGNRHAICNEVREDAHAALKAAAYQGRAYRARHLHQRSAFEREFKLDMNVSVRFSISTSSDS